jgi:hypothetical protein
MRLIHTQSNFSARAEMRTRHGNLHLACELHGPRNPQGQGFTRAAALTGRAVTSTAVSSWATETRPAANLDVSNQETGPITDIAETDEIGPTSDIGRPRQRLSGCTVVPIPADYWLLVRYPAIRPWLAWQVEHEAARVHHPSLWGHGSVAARGALGANRQCADRHTLAVVLF